MYSLESTAEQQVEKAKKIFLFKLVSCILEGSSKLDKDLTAGLSFFSISTEQADNVLGYLQKNLFKENISHSRAVPVTQMLSSFKEQFKKLSNEEQARLLPVRQGALLVAAQAVLDDLLANVTKNNLDLIRIAIKKTNEEKDFAKIKRLLQSDLGRALINSKQKKDTALIKGVIKVAFNQVNVVQVSAVKEGEGESNDLPKDSAIAKDVLKLCIPSAASRALFASEEEEDINLVTAALKATLQANDEVLIKLFIPSAASKALFASEEEEGINLVTAALTAALQSNNSSLAKSFIPSAASNRMFVEAESEVIKKALKVADKSKNIDMLVLLAQSKQGLTYFTELLLPKNIFYRGWRWFANKIFFSNVIEKKITPKMLVKICEAQPELWKVVDESKLAWFAQDWQGIISQDLEGQVRLKLFLLTQENIINWLGKSKQESSKIDENNKIIVGAKVWWGVLQHLTNGIQRNDARGYQKQLLILNEQFTNMQGYSAKELGEIIKVLAKLLETVKVEEQELDFDQYYQFCSILLEAYSMPEGKLTNKKRQTTVSEDQKGKEKEDENENKEGKKEKEEQEERNENEMENCFGEIFTGLEVTFSCEELVRLCLGFRNKMLKSYFLSKIAQKYQKSEKIKSSFLIMEQMVGHEKNLLLKYYLLNIVCKYNDIKNPTNDQLELLIKECTRLISLEENLSMKEGHAKHAKKSMVSAGSSYQKALAEIKRDFTLQCFLSKLNDNDTGIDTKKINKCRHLGCDDFSENNIKKTVAYICTQLKDEGKREMVMRSYMEGVFCATTKQDFAIFNKNLTLDNAKKLVFLYLQLQANFSREHTEDNSVYSLLDKFIEETNKKYNLKLEKTTQVVWSLSPKNPKDSSNGKGVGDNSKQPQYTEGCRNQ